MYWQVYVVTQLKKSGTGVVSNSTILTPDTYSHENWSMSILERVWYVNTISQINNDQISDETADTHTTIHTMELQACMIITYNTLMSTLDIENMLVLHDHQLV